MKMKPVSCFILQHLGSPFMLLHSAIPLWMHLSLPCEKPVDYDWKLSGSAPNRSSNIFVILGQLHPRKFVLRFKEQRMQGNYEFFATIQPLLHQEQKLHGKNLISFHSWWSMLCFFLNEKNYCISNQIQAIKLLSCYLMTNRNLTDQLDNKVDSFFIVH